MSYWGKFLKNKSLKLGGHWRNIIVVAALGLIHLGSPSAKAQTTEEEKDQLFSNILAPLAEDSVKACISCLWKHTKHGFQKTEAAAWLVKGPSGYSCLYWPVNFETTSHPPSGAVAVLRWKGVIPSGMIALIHSHPIGGNSTPSDTDLEVVKRLQVPNYVVSNDGVKGGLFWLKKKNNGKVSPKVSVVDVYSDDDVKNMSRLLDSNNCPDQMPNHMLWRMDSTVDLL